MFGQAAAAWKELSEEQRKQYTLVYAGNAEDPKLDQLPVPASQAKASVKAESAAEKVTMYSVTVLTALHKSQTRNILDPEMQ